MNPKEQKSQPLTASPAPGPARRRGAGWGERYRARKDGDGPLKVSPSPAAARHGLKVRDSVVYVGSKTGVQAEIVRIHSHNVLDLKPKDSDEVIQGVPYSPKGHRFFSWHKPEEQ